MKNKSMNFVKAAKKVVPNEAWKRLGSEILRIKKVKKTTRFKEYGIVITIQDGIAVVTGLKNVGLTETVRFTNGILAMVSTLERDIVRLCLMGPDRAVQPGDTVYRLKKFIEVPVGNSVLGRVIDSLGRPLDGKGKLVAKTNTVAESAVATPTTSKAKVRKHTAKNFISSAIKARMKRLERLTETLYSRVTKIKHFARKRKSKRGRKPKPKLFKAKRKTKLLLLLRRRQKKIKMFVLL